MARTKNIGLNVFDASIERMKKVYEEGHRVIVSFSGGKDSGCCVEICRIAARETGNLPVEVVTRDEEIMLPGTFEYVDRIYHDKDIKLHNLIAGQPIINAFNRESPYWWVFDSREKDKWLRQPPKHSIWIEEKNIEQMTIPSRFPPPEGKRLMAVIGLRVSESMNRKMGLLSSGHYLTKPNTFGVVNCRPLYDWRDEDIWKSIYDNKWDYNKAYDILHRIGMDKNSLRIAPPTFYQTINNLKYFLMAFPKWFNKLEERLPGMTTAAQFGKRVIQPIRLLGESWEECCKRIYSPANSPQWIIDRYNKALKGILSIHKRHSPHSFPQAQSCRRCPPNARSWKQICNKLYMGDPFIQYYGKLPYIEPEFFRKGAGTWGGKPAF